MENIPFISPEFDENEIGNDSLRIRVSSCIEGQQDFGSPFHEWPQPPGDTHAYEEAILIYTLFIYRNLVKRTTRSAVYTIHVR